jgi:hypothetical protein
MENCSKKIHLVLSFILIMLASCNKDVANIDISHGPNQSFELKTLVSQIKIWHDSIVNPTSNNSNENIVKSQSIVGQDIIPPTINWSLAFINYDSADVKSVTVPITYNISTGELFQLVATTKNNSINGYFVKLIPDSVYYSIHPNILDLSGYTGRYLVYDLNGHLIKDMAFQNGGALSKNSSVPSKNGGITSNQVSAPCETCDLVTVTVTGYIPSAEEVNNFYQEYYGYSIISLAGDVMNSNASPSVIAGGGSIYSSTLLNLVTVPDGECVFGSLAYIGKLVGADSEPDSYITQWAEHKKMSLLEMKFKILHDNSFRPNFQESIDLLKKNFQVTPLSNNTAVINAAKLGKPIFVLNSWGNGNGHCVVLGWNSSTSSLYYYEPTDDQTHNIAIGDEFYNTFKYFYAVNGINFLDL